MAANFAALGVSEALCKALDELEFTDPTPVQVKTIPFLLEKRDLLAQAQTGTGKTAAFGLPLLDLMDPTSNQVQGIVLTPTRELAMQVSDAMYTYAKYQSLRILPIYGGQPIDRQIRRLRSGAHVVVGTPGRVIDLMQRGNLKLDGIKLLVLDEADQMLNMGFIDDVQKIIDATPAERQLAFFSATLPTEIRRLANRSLRDPLTVTIVSNADTIPRITQMVYQVTFKSRPQALSRILAAEEPASAFIFTRTKQGADELADWLQRDGYRVEALHGDLSQSAREHVLNKFRRQQLNIVVATDVAARGLDIGSLSHVINYDLPADGESYVHRIGRTGRAGRTGTAISLALPTDRFRVRQIERVTNQPMIASKVPTNDEIESRRWERLLETLRMAMQTAQADQALPQYRALVGQLSQEYSLEDIAAISLKLSQQKGVAG
jgi:ATP-dependent RNA helicase DeaD